MCTIFEPLKKYYEFDQKRLNVIIDVFEKLIHQANVIPTTNQKILKNYQENNAILQKIKRKIIYLLIFKCLSSILIFFFAVIMFYFFRFQIKKNTISLTIILISSFVLALFSNIIFLIKINRWLKNNNDNKIKYQLIIEENLNQAWQQMQPLNDLYDWSISEKIFNQIVSEIKLDLNFDSKKYFLLMQHYHYQPDQKENISISMCRSGAIKNNPFLQISELQQIWQEHVYVGQKIIFWFEKINGKRIPRSQILFAHVTKPEPIYTSKTFLIYGHDAAPNLCFTRQYTTFKHQNDVKTAQYVKQKSYQLEKLAQQSLKNDIQAFTKLANDEFESLFLTTDRNHEVQFRLLFTPLGQKNILALIKNNPLYGDDFCFYKKNKINFIMSKHSQTINYYGDPKEFITYDLMQAREKFIQYQTIFFHGLYFDLAPLLAIPIYHQPAISLDIDEKQLTSISPYEYEMMANVIDKKYITPSQAQTTIILKTIFKKKISTMNLIQITAHAYNKIPRVSFIPTLGGDGHMHSVAVNWFEYVPVTKTIEVLVVKKDHSRASYQKIAKTETFKKIILNFNDDGYCFLFKNLFVLLITKPLKLDQLLSFEQYYQEHIN